MSKLVKDLVRKELIKRFDGVESFAVVGISGLDAVSTNEIRGRLREKDIRISVVKNSLARQAFREVGLEAGASLLAGPCAVAYGQDHIVGIVRELLEIKKESPAFEVKAALMDGEAFGGDRVEELSKYPTRVEALSMVSGSVLSSGGRLAGSILGPGGKIASILKTIEEKQETAGEGDEAAA